MAYLNRKISFVLYLIILVHYLSTLKFASSLNERSTNTSAASQEYFQQLGQFQLSFFTGWNFVLQIIFLGIALADDIIALLNLPKPIKTSTTRIRSYLFSAFVLPIGGMVVVIFWTMYKIDRKMIFPEEIDEIIPTWMNHTLHTFIAAPIIIELLLPKEHSFVTFVNAFVGLTVYVAVYQTRFVLIYIQHGVWLYLIYNDLTWIQRILFTLLKYSVGLVFLKIGLVIQNNKQNMKMKIK